MLVFDNCGKKDNSEFPLLVLQSSLPYQFYNSAALNHTVSQRFLAHCFFSHHVANVMFSFTFILWDMNKWKSYTFTQLNFAFPISMYSMMLKLSDLLKWSVLVLLTRQLVYLVTKYVICFTELVLAEYTLVVIVIHSTLPASTDAAM